jgi:hypothetical protein
MAPLSIWTPPATEDAPPQSVVERAPADERRHPPLDAMVDGAPARDPEYRAWLQARIDAIGALGDAARTDLARRWPPGVPTLRGSTEHTGDQLAAIEVAVKRTADEFSMPWEPPKPGEDPTDDAAARWLRAFPGSTLISERTKR